MTQEDELLNVPQLFFINNKGGQILLRIEQCSVVPIFHGVEGLLRSWPSHPWSMLRKAPLQPIVNPQENWAPQMSR